MEILPPNLAPGAADFEDVLVTDVFPRPVRLEQARQVVAATETDAALTITLTIYVQAGKPGQYVAHVAFASGAGPTRRRLFARLSDPLGKNALAYWIDNRGDEPVPPYVVRAMLGSEADAAMLATLQATLRQRLRNLTCAALAHRADLFAERR